jgi:prevent-host-death family protein
MPNISKNRRRVTDPHGPSPRKLPGRVWQLQTAKARFSEVFRLARSEGPQLITRQGKDGVVMLPVEQFDELVVRSRQPKSLVQFFRKSPLVGLELDFERDRDSGRNIEL